MLKQGAADVLRDGFFKSGIEAAELAAQLVELIQQ
jgi:hypothetical protein